MGRELIEAFDMADADDDVRAVIVTGAGRGCCAGAVRGLHVSMRRLPVETQPALEIAANAAPVAVALARQMMWRMLGAPHPMFAHRADSRAMFARGQSADVVEGVSSFLEKRQPAFGDRVSDGLPEIMPGWEAPGFE